MQKVKGADYTVSTPGLSEEEEHELQELLKQEARENLGEVLVHRLIPITEEYLAEHNESSLEQQMHERKRAEERAEEQLWVRQVRDSSHSLHCHTLTAAGAAGPSLDAGGGARDGGGAGID